MHTFLEIDGIEHTDFVSVIRKELSALDDKAAFRRDFVKINVVYFQRISMIESIIVIVKIKLKILFIDNLLS